MLSSYTNEKGTKEMEQSLLNNPEMLTMVLCQQTSDVSLAFRIETVVSRVMFALSMPEYIEAWLQAPDREGLQFHFNPVTQDAFRIDLYRAETLERSIQGLCRVVNANQVRYTWRTTSSTSTTETLVDLWLRNSSGGCILGLKHSGFRDKVDSEWCRRMWNQSLGRLSRLMKKD
jgi:uncharacterized protein YndB with AHSA1/START domain